MPHKAFSWFIMVAGLTVTAIAVIYIFGLIEQYSLDATYTQLTYFAGMVAFIAGTVITTRLYKWYDKK
jgi:hypothetical protein